MRLFITGASGYLGGRIIARLLNAPEIEFFALKRRTSSIEKFAGAGDRIRWHDVDDAPMEAIIKKAAPDVVLHAATRYAAAPDGMAGLVATNVALPVRMLDAAIMTGVRTFINIDTVLGGAVSPYTLSKSQFRDWLRVGSGSIRAVDLASELFYGTGGDERNFVTGMVRRLVRGDGRVPLTAGEQVRDFVVIDDLVAAVECILLHIADGPATGYERFEVGGAAPRTVREFATSVCGAAGRSEDALQFGAIPYRPGESMRVVPDLAKIKELGWSPAASFRDTIMGMVEEERARACQNT